MTPCDADTEAAIQALDAALSDVRVELRILLPDLAPVDPPAFTVDDRGVALGIRIPAEPTCESTLGPVVRARFSPMPGSGAAEPFRGAEVLWVGTHDEGRDGWDDVGWKAILAHEWVHLHHATIAGASSRAYRQRPLEARFRKDPAFVGAVVTLIDAAWEAHRDCADPARLRSALAAYDALTARRRTDSDRWLFTEGIARTWEVAWEARARSADPEAMYQVSCGTTRSTDPVTGAVSASVSIEGGRYAYAVGCGLALALDRCVGDGWRETAWTEGFRPALHRADLAPAGPDAMDGDED